MVEIILFITIILLQHYKCKVNILIMYILCLVIPTKVDTSQVPQQNVDWIPAVKAMVNTTGFSRLICTTTVGQ